MNISYRWLKEYINLDYTADEVSAFLTQIGLEVGSMEEVETIKGGLRGLVIGEVLTCEQHPDSDHLSKTTVNVGNGEVLPIVCGAPNVAAGQKVVVATWLAQPCTMATQNLKSRNQKSGAKFLKV